MEQIPSPQETTKVNSMILKYSTNVSILRKRDPKIEFTVNETVDYEQFNFCKYLSYPKWMKIGNDLYMASHLGDKHFRKEVPNFFLKEHIGSLYPPMSYIDDPQIL